MDVRTQAEIFEKAKVIKDGENLFGTLLTDLGFEAEGRPHWTLWRFHAPERDSALVETQSRAKMRRAARTSVGAPSPWQLQSLELSERKGHLSIHRMKIRLDQDAFVRNLNALTRKYFGARARADFVRGKDGDLWCIFEFTRPGSREKSPGNNQTTAGALLPQGLGGFHVHVTADGGTSHALAVDSFGVGYLPQGFASVPLRFVADALGLKSLGNAFLADIRPTSIHEIRYPVVLPALSVMAESLGLVGDRLKSLATLKELLVKTRAPVHCELTKPSGDLEMAIPGSDDGAHAFVPHVPMEVLESRERGGRFVELDSLILASKYRRAVKVADAALDKEQRDPFLMRRRAILALVGQRDAPRDFAATALSVEPDAKIFLSFAANEALTEGDVAGTLRYVSRLGAELSEALGNLEALSTFDVVLPELLGDAWCHEDRRKAEECYQRIIAKRGDMPRILRKLINLARSSGRTADEASYLQRLAKVERRRTELAKLYHRLAELSGLDAAGRPEAIQLALRSLKLDRSYHPAAALAASLLIEQGDGVEAIGLLDGLLRDESLPLAPKIRSRLEGLIGHTWFRSLSRPDLAKTRLEQAMAHDATNIEALKDLEELYRHAHDVAGLAVVLEARFDAHERSGDSDALRDIFEELAALYRGSMGEPKRAFDLYQRLLLSASIGYQEIDRVLAWRDVEIDWSDLYAKLVTKVSSVPEGEKRGRYLCRLAEICREKINDEALAVDHYRAAIETGWIDPSGFQFLVEVLTRVEDYQELARCYEARIGQVSLNDQRALTLELLALPSVLSDEKRDQLAIHSYVLDRSADKAILQRLRYYQSVDDVEALDRLVSLIQNEPTLGELDRTNWCRLAIETFEACIDDHRFVVMDRLYAALLEQTEDSVQVLQDAVTSLRHSGNARLLLPYVTRLLEAGVLPGLDERETQRLLTGLDPELALYHQLMSHKCTRADQAAQHARMAAALYGKRPNQEANSERMLARVGTLVTCSEGDLNELKELVQKTDNWALLAKVLQKQADLEDERRRKFALLEWLGRIYWQKLKDYNRSRLTYVMATKLAPEPWRLRLTLASLAAESGDTEHERKALLEFLQDTPNVASLPSLGKAVARLLRLGDEPAKLQAVVVSHITAAQYQGDHELSGALCAVLIDNQIATTDVHKIAFKTAVARKNTELAVSTWWRGLSSVANKSKAKAYMAETTLILERAERRDLLMACYQTALSNDIGAHLGPQVRYEILLQYGVLLFDNDERRNEAFPIYREAFACDPDDSRSWMPLYFLLLEFGEPVDRLAHLKATLPRLTKDPRPLKSFPITVESLAAEFRELSEEFDDVPAVQRKVAGEAEQFGDAISEGTMVAEPVDELSEGSYDETSIASVAAAEPVALSSALADGAASDLGLGEPLSADAGPLPLSLFLNGGSELHLNNDRSHAMIAPKDEPSPSASADDEKSDVVFSLNDVESEEPIDALPVLDWDVGVDGDPEPDSELSLNETPSFDLGSSLHPEPQLSSEATDAMQVFSLDDDVSPTDDDSAAVLRAAEASEDSSVELSMALELESEEEADPEQEPTTMTVEGDLLLTPDMQSGIPLPNVDQAVIDLGDIRAGLDLSLPDLPGIDVSGTAATVSTGTSGTSGLSGTAGTAGTASSRSLSSGANTSFAGDQSDDVGDWRAAVVKGDINADLTGKLLKQAFASELEKHVAIQCVALVAGNCDKLATWHWRVWRKPEEYGYPLMGKDRYPQGGVPKALETLQYKYVLAAAPLLVKVYKPRFTTGYLASKLELQPGAIEKLRRPMSWTDGLLGQVGFHLYVDRIADRRYQVFNLPGLGANIFYEGAARTFYLDEAFYRKQPPSHLFHRLLGTLWSVRLHTFVPLALIPQKHVMPVLREAHQFFSAQGISKIKSRLGGGSEIAKMLTAMDTSQLRSLHEKVGLPTEDQLLQIWEAMRQHVYRLLIAETLDLVGIFEMMMQKDLTAPNALKHSDIFKSLPAGRSLIEFATRLKLVV